MGKYKYYRVNKHYCCICLSLIQGMVILHSVCIQRLLKSFLICCPQDFLSKTWELLTIAYCGKYNSIIVLWELSEQARPQQLGESRSCVVSQGMRWIEVIYMLRASSQCFSAFQTSALKSNLDNVGYISELVWRRRVDLCLVVVVIFAIIIINIIIITTYFECVTLIAVIMHMFCGAHSFIGETICIL